MSRQNFHFSGARAVRPVAAIFTVIFAVIAAFALIVIGTVSTERGIEPAFAKEKSEKSTGDRKGVDGDEEGTDAKKKTEKKVKGKTKKKTKKKRTKKPKKKLSEDEVYVQDMLEEYLHPSKIKFLKDGRVEMSFDFGKKNPDHEEIFSRRISTKINSKLRWSVRGEEWYYRGRGASGRSYGGGGLRISDAGMAVLNCWFEDSVEVEIVYGTGTNYRESQTAAVVFCNRKGNSIGNNYGTQCAKFSKNRPVTRKGTPKSMDIFTAARFKLVVKDGEFEAHRNGRKGSEMTYSEKKFASGRIGIVWGGKVAGFVFSMTIKGKIDAPRMAKDLKKVMRRKRR